MIETFLEYLRTYKDEWGTIAAIVAVVVFAFGILRWLLIKKPNNMPEKDVVIATKSSDMLTISEFIRIRKDMKADLEEEFKEAAEKDKAPLLARIAELERQIASPDEALFEAQKRIKALEALLDREGNDIGAERIEAAKAALEQGDYSLADEIFADIEAIEGIAVKRAARAALGRGEVAEAEVRWQDAAKHYTRAAQLDPMFDALVKAREFAWRTGDYTAALRLGEELVSLSAQGSLTVKQKATAYSAHALTLQTLGQYDEAKQLYRQAIEIDSKNRGLFDPIHATRLNNLALLLKLQGHYGEAEGLYRKVLEVDVKTVGTLHPDYAKTLNNLSLVVLALKRFEEAEVLSRRALKVTKSALGTEHPEYATRLSNLATILRATGRNSDVESLYRKALEVDAKTIGTAHSDYATGLNNFASVLEAQGQYEAAEDLHRQALDIDAKAIGTAHPSYATDLNNLAIVLHSQGQYDEAEKHCRQAIDIMNASLGSEHPNTIQVRKNLEILIANSKL